MHLRNLVLPSLLIPMLALADDRPFQVAYAANLNQGESYINIINDGANGAPLLGRGMGAVVGNICVNVYAFDPNEEMLSCCSCLLTPNQVRNLGVNRDITHNTATGVVPTSVIIELLATLAGTGGSATDCKNSAAAVSTATTVPGMVAYGTTLHPQGSDYVTVSIPFTPATLSAGELASLSTQCANITGNLSGFFGICASCRMGAPGASKQ